MSLMSKTKLPASKEEWFFENYKQGAVFEFGPVEVEEEEVLKFARRYDPQPFHINAEAGTSGRQTHGPSHHYRNKTFKVKARQRNCPHIY